MPYIDKMRRGDIEVELDKLVLSIKKSIPITEQRAGMANFVIITLLLNVLKPVGGWNYASLAGVIATLECSKQEIYRRLVAPYEELATKRNGDLPELSG